MAATRSGRLLRILAFGVIAVLLETSVLVARERLADPLRTAQPVSPLGYYVSHQWSPSFVPMPSPTGDPRVLPLVFPDGSRAKLVYPESLRLAERGAAPVAFTEVADGPDGRYPMSFTYQPDAEMWDDDPLRSKTGVPIGRGAIASGRGRPGHHMLAYLVKGWWVTIVFPAGLDQDEAAARADLRLSKEGFPVVTLERPVRFAGPMAIVLGSNLPFWLSPWMSPGVVTVEVAREGCDPELDFVRRSASRRCVGEPGGQLLIDARGPETFVRRVYEDVSVREVQLAP